MTSQNASYRKYNDRTHNSSTYHKKDGTPIRSKLKEETKEQIKQFLKERKNHHNGPL